MKLDNFINRPVLSTVISIFIVVLGLIGLFSLPITQYPDIAPPTIQVETTYTGANAQAVLNSVIAPLEESINGAEGMTYMESTATNNGTATINVYFEQGFDPDMAAVDVQNRVAKATNLLPAEVTQVGVITKKRQTSMLVGVALYDPTGQYSLPFIENYMKINIVPDLQRVSGVGDVMVFGADYSMRIWLKPDVMAQYHLMPEDVTAALAEQNIEAAPGTFGEQADQSLQYIMRYRGRLDTPEQFGDIVVRAASDGEVLRLKDIADIELGRVTYALGGRMNGNPSVMAIVFQSPGTNATQIINDCLKVVDQVRPNLPKGLEINVPMNNNEFLYASIHEVVKTLIEAFILVFIVVYIFLQDIRSTIVPSVAIPVALVGTFFAMKLMGFSLNLITLSALVLAIAIVVDDAIVVVEAVHAKLDVGYHSARRAAIDAMGEIAGALISITLVMMLVFIPVSFVTGTSGVFYRQFGLTMACAIFFSAVNALTLSPALCALLLKPHPDDPEAERKRTFVQRFHMGFNAVYDSMLSRYGRLVKGIIRFRYAAFVAVGAAIVLLVWMMRNTPTDLVPAEDTGTLFGMVSMPPGTTLERTTEALEQTNELIMSTPGVQDVQMIQGYGLVAGQGSTYGSFIIKLKNWADRGDGEHANDVVKQLFAKSSAVKDANVVFFAPPMIAGYSITNGFELKMLDRTGGDVNAFFAVVQGFLGQLNQQPEIQMAYTTFNPSYPQYMVDIDAAKAKQAGISPKSLLSTLQGYYGGMYVSNFNRFGKIYRVMMQANPESRISPETLNQIKVRNGSEMAPISNFIRLSKVYGPDLLNRFNMFQSIAVTGEPKPGYSSGEALAAVRRVAAETLPTGYTFDYAGMTREQANSSGDSTAGIFGIVLLFVYLILAAQYESYILPWAVILSVPFGLMGTFIFAEIFSLSNNIYLQIALIMLIGLLAKNAILIVEFALDRRKTGMSIVNAALAGAKARLRPILMTSLALVIGLLPLGLASGAGANGNHALGWGSIGGMLIGMILQVVFVPALFVAFQSLQERLSPIKWRDTDNAGIQSEIEQYGAATPDSPAKA